VLLLGIEGNRYLVLSGDYVLSLANGDKRDSDVIDSDDEELVIESVGGTISATMVAGTDEIVDFEMSYDQNIRAMESDTELEYNVVMALKDKTIISAEELRAIFDLGKD
jgi:hypothetical protein